ncbi:hypothetical protein GLUCOINTEAF2_0203245 [Komagataeibacter intermedius AF2]|uniref:Uncharacterized protein n=1 Tax=Komagataeibacter intermedius AF2 TaxID=1458464 RepID=A0A0N1F832_9PROT|nr:hypothetical protein GLUCOINTEAF2_0203245 [Komagataeibacter intermedius AF2]
MQLLIFVYGKMAPSCTVNLFYNKFSIFQPISLMWTNIAHYNVAGFRALGFADADNQNYCRPSAFGKLERLRL